MARLILKSPYIKGGARAGNYARYIATRERVELVPDGRPATKKQEQLIVSLVKDFPGTKKLPEYGSYRETPSSPLRIGVLKKMTSQMTRSRPAMCTGSSGQ